MRRLAYPVLLLVLAGCSQPAPPPEDESDKALLRTIEEPQQRAKAVEADLLRAQNRSLDAADAADEAAKQDPDAQGD